jgi:uncharacterized protein YyaL (SSP411 family)
MVAIKLNMENTNKKPNALIHESSPYLLQHAYNPVDWQPWSNELLEKAQKENKPLIISIGYSACHWCHVMEHESFEDEEVAALMNQYFICIKIDREERPDIDQIYMTAVQLMTGKGGWPLNCFAMPDGSPIYGGTYFHKKGWLAVIQQIHQLYTNDIEEVKTYAEQLKKGIIQTELFKVESKSNVLTENDLYDSVNNWMHIVDNEEGGPNRAPKFPLPNNYLFLLQYAHLSKRKEVLQHVHLTLTKMAWGGIYDQIGGGFARYSVDGIWKVPHFEKMLYDNGQLLSLYAFAYQESGNELYKEICIQIIAFILRELTHEKGYFFSALDADSEGVEGKYYTWKKEELISILNEEEFKIIQDYYNINHLGFWEHEQYILLRANTDEHYASQLNLSEEAFKNKINAIQLKLLKIRENRIKPGLDNKLLTSWNAIAIKGLMDCSVVFKEKSFYEKGKETLNYLLDNLIVENELFHTIKNEKAAIPAFLEDYCFLIDALIAIYKADFKEEWLFKAKWLMELSIANFSDENGILFYFTNKNEKTLIVRPKEISDNVIPASNSVMANNLYYLGIIFNEANWINRGQKMLMSVKNEFIKYGAGYSNWGILAIQNYFNASQIVITGENAFEVANELKIKFNPHLIICANNSKSNLPIFQGKGNDKEVKIYICEGNTCKKPVTSLQDLYKNNLNI